MRTGLACVALLFALGGCAIDSTSSGAEVSERQALRALHGIRVSPVTHAGARFGAMMPSGPGWSNVELAGRLLALELGVPTPVTVVVSVRAQGTVADLVARWRGAFKGKGFRVAEDVGRDAVVLLAEGTEAVSGRSVDTVVIRVLSDGRAVQCSVGAPAAEARTWAQAIREICDTVEPVR
ncbi:MAG: hypothetical protein AMXMBFR64_36380 [Myxococcales bacterium]